MATLTDDGKMAMEAAGTEYIRKLEAEVERLREALRDIANRGVPIHREEHRHSHRKRKNK